MTNSLLTFERRARYLMSFIALLMIVALVLFKTGLVSTAPSYNAQAWYSVSDHAGFVITTEYADEAACRSSAPSIVCRSGKYLTAAAGKQRFN
ncbi:MAG: hypothetical protein JWQ21_2641 [Herminiimonas sp.]|nr:hypothetical protein [Herminiimonas sp.]